MVAEVAHRAAAAGVARYQGAEGDADSRRVAGRVGAGLDAAEGGPADTEIALMSLLLLLLYLLAASVAFFVFALWWTRRPCRGRKPVPHSHPGGVLCFLEHPCRCGGCGSDSWKHKDWEQLSDKEKTEVTKLWKEDDGRP